jgi:hypothetical protein
MPEINIDDARFLAFGFAVCSELNDPNRVGHLDWKQPRWRIFAQPTLLIESPPLEKLVRIHIMCASHQRNRRPRLQRLFDYLPALLLRSIPSPPPFPCVCCCGARLHRHQSSI